MVSTIRLEDSNWEKLQLVKLNIIKFNKGKKINMNDVVLKLIETYNKYYIK